MISKEIIFKVTDSQYFKIINLCSEGNDHLYRFDEVEIFFIDQKNQYELGNNLLIVPI